MYATNIAVVMAEEIITEDQSKKILAKWATNRKASLISFCTEPLSNMFDGLIGEQYFLTLTYQEGKKKDKIRFFVKIISKTNQAMYKISKELRAYEKESFFYEKFVPALQKYNFQCDYLAKSYLCESSTIVLEDLSQLSYKGSGKTGCLNLDHCYNCLRTIARFHADGILFQLLKSQELAKEYNLKEDFSDIFDETILNNDCYISKYFYYSVKGIINIANLLPNDGIKPEEFEKSVLSALHDLSDIETTRRNFTLTITHNDLWTNNFLYQYDEYRKVKSCKIIDFQTLSLRPPAFDVMGFLFLNTRKETRDNHFNDFFKFYYECFSTFVKEEGFNPNKVLDENEFYKSCDILMTPVKLDSIIDRSITLISEDVFADVLKSEEMHSKFLFEDRPRYMMESFMKNDQYKEIMTEDIKELRSLLFR